MSRRPYHASGIRPSGCCSPTSWAALGKPSSVPSLPASANRRCWRATATATATVESRPVPKKSPRPLTGNRREEHPFLLPPTLLGLCPGTKISGGKVLSARTKRFANRVRQALKMAAMSLLHSERLGTGRVLPPTLQSNRQAARQHRHGPQARAHAVLHAHPWRGLRRSRPATLRAAAARGIHRHTQAPRHRARLPDHSDTGARINACVFSFVSCESKQGAPACC